MLFCLCSSAASSRCFLLLSQNQIAPAMAAAPTTPTTTPAAIAAVLVPPLFLSAELVSVGADTEMVAGAAALSAEFVMTTVWVAPALVTTETAVVAGATVVDGDGDESAELD